MNLIYSVCFDIWTAICTSIRIYTSAMHIWDRNVITYRKFYDRYGDLIQQYEVSLLRMLNDILTLDQQWLPTDQTFHQFYVTLPSLTFTELWVVACKQGTLILPKTWFWPFGTCLCSNCWDQILRTFHVFTRFFTLNTHWYSRFCFHLFFMI